jgi:hypothetical protein
MRGFFYFLCSVALAAAASGGGVSNPGGDPLMVTDASGNAPIVAGQIIVLRTQGDVSLTTTGTTGNTFYYNGAPWSVPTGKSFVMTGGKVVATTVTGYSSTTLAALKIEDSSGAQISSSLTVSSNVSSGGKYAALTLGGTPATVPAGRSLRVNVTTANTSTVFSGPCFIEGFLQ